MNRLTILLILIAVIAGMGIMFVHQQGASKKVRKLEQKLEAVDREVRKPIALDSLQSVIEARVIARNDSMIALQQREIEKLKFTARQLKLKDQHNEKTLDSLRQLIPGLPEW